MRARQPQAVPQTVLAPQASRPMERGWRERMIRWQAEGCIPLGKTQLRHADGSLAFDRLGRPRVWSQHVADAMVSGRRHSKTIARERAKAEEKARQAVEAARVAAEVAALRALVFPSLKPLPGRLWSTHEDALLLIGPLGGIAVPASAVKILAPLASGGWHDLQDRDRTALDALAPRITAVGLRIDARRDGVRLAKARALTA